MKKFRYFILVLAGVAAMMLGGCKMAEYDESAFQNDMVLPMNWSHGSE